MSTAGPEAIRERRRVEFRVDGHLPPKKDGANSMWAKPTDIPRLIALRVAACEAMHGGSPFVRGISLKLEIHALPRTLASIGDLDNFITGICDGLMAANPRIRADARWLAPELATVRPEICIAIADDGQVVSIQATKADDAADPWYTVSLEGE